MPLNFRQELNSDTFNAFAERNADIAYVKAQKATHNASKSEDIAAKALKGVLKSLKQLEKQSDLVSEEKAVDIVMRGMLSTKEIKQLDSPDGADDFNVSLPDLDTISRIVEKACGKAKSPKAPKKEKAPRPVKAPKPEKQKKEKKADADQPTIAPTYTGTRSAIVLFLVVVFILVAIFAIWFDPLGWIGEEERDASRDAQVISAVVPMDGSLVDVRFEPSLDSGVTIPVRVYVDGPDVRNIVSVTYMDERTGQEKQAFRCGDEYYVMMVSSNSYYRLNIKGNSGLDVTRYYRIPDAQSDAPEIIIKKSSVSKDKSTATVKTEIHSYSGDIFIQSDPEVIVEESDNGEYSFTAPVGSNYYINAKDGAGKTSTLLIAESGKAYLQPELTVSELEIGHDRTYTVSLTDILPSGRNYSCHLKSNGDDVDASIDSSGTLSLQPSASFVGVNSICVEVNDDLGLTSTQIVPVVVVNTQPYVKNDSQLYCEISHTPSRTGHLFGSLAADDKENDELKYELVGTQDCNVTLAQNGSFILLVEPDFRGRTVSFSFKASDGLLVSDIYTYTVELKNNILSKKTFTESFVCYSGEDGWYTVDLPKTDEDGDTLNWSIASELDGAGRTAKGNYLKFADGFTTLCVRPDPKRNEDFSEEIKLTCSDGWLTSDELTLVCKFKKNQAPKPGSGNSSEIAVTEKSGSFMLNVSNDSQFDRCAITKVISASGCEVVENEGWSELRFTVQFADEEPRNCVVIFRVEDILTGDGTNVRYTIKRIA